MSESNTPGVVDFDGARGTGSSTRLTRRTAVIGAGVSACTCALAACGRSTPKKVEPVDFTLEAAKVPVGSGFIDSTHNTVITQPSKGTYKAFSSVCTHQGCQVGSVKGGVITCPCHGSEFDATTGAVKAPPAESGLAARKVTLRGTTLHVTG